MKRLTITGFLLTAIWICAFGLVLGTNWTDAVGMNLNEWGDFLAGFLAPLALMWIVIGYFLQGKELRINTEALKAQQEELRRQVEETALLAKSAERQASAAENAVQQSREESLRIYQNEWSRSRMKLKIVHGIDTAQGTCRAVLQNVGDPVSHVALGSESSEIRIKGGSTLNSGDQLKLAWSASTPFPVHMVLKYRDAAGRGRESEFLVTHTSELTEQAETDQEGNPYYR